MPYPRQVHRNPGYDDDPNAQQWHLGRPPAENLFAERRILEQNESAERDERERQVVDEGDRPPQLHGRDAHDVAKRPALEDVVRGVGGDGDEAEEEVAEGQVQDVGDGGVVGALEAKLAPVAGERHGEQGEQVTADAEDDVDGLGDDVEGDDALALHPGVAVLRGVRAQAEGAVLDDARHVARGHRRVVPQAGELLLKRTR